MTTIIAILTILAIMAWLNMVLNMVIIGVYGKIRKNVVIHENGIEKIEKISKDMAKSKSTQKLGAFLLYVARKFWALFDILNRPNVS